MKPVSFFRAFWGSCCGTAIFEDLKDQSVVRLILHLFLLAALLGILFDLAAGSRVNDAIRDNAAGLDREFGRLQLRQGKLTPQLRAAEPRRYALLNRGLLCYLPDGKMPQLSTLDKSLHTYFVFWQPGKLTAAVSYAPDDWHVSTLLMPQTSAQKLRMLAGRSATPLQLDRPQVLELQNTLPATFQANLGALAAEIYLAILVHVPAFFHFLAVLLLPVVEVFFFALVFALTGGARKLRYLTMGKFLKIGFYAAFPALAFASLFPILALPFFSFSTVAMLGNVIYWLYIVNQLEFQHFKEEGEK